MKLLYSDILSENNLVFNEKEFVKIIELNKTDYLQIVTWRDNDLADFTHYRKSPSELKRLNHIVIKGAFNLKNCKITAIYELDIGILISEHQYTEE